MGPRARHRLSDFARPWAPFAIEPKADNHWVQNAGPHIMVVVSEHRLLGLPIDPENSGPWLMGKGSPSAHIMIPTVPRQR